jgi:LuxR family quorum sensing-dependent transcriptional regulator
MSKLDLTAALIESCERISAPDAIGAALYDTLKGFGARSLVLADMRGNATRHFSLAGPVGWYDYYFKNDLRQGNPVFRELRRRASAFVWSECANGEAGDARWYKALNEFEMPDGMSIACHGPDGYLGWISFTVERMEISPDERRMIALAGLAVHDRARTLAGDLPFDGASGQMSSRERDALAFVAEGKSDWEISVILGVSQTTAHAHVENAKRKLGAKSRAQAVARAVRAGLI